MRYVARAYDARVLRRVAGVIDGVLMCKLVYTRDERARRRRRRRGREVPAGPHKPFPPATASRSAAISLSHSASTSSTMNSSSSRTCGSMSHPSAGVNNKSPPVPKLYRSRGAGL